MQLQVLDVNVTVARFQLSSLGGEVGILLLRGFQQCRGALWSVTSTDDELSVFGDAALFTEALLVAAEKVEPGWRVLRVQGPLDFSLTGVLASLATPLAAAGVSIFAFSTFDTDYVLVRADALVAACAALTSAGHSVTVLST